jgi:DNA-binding transcriptional ArsR family regulator
MQIHSSCSSICIRSPDRHVADADLQLLPGDKASGMHHLTGICPRRHVHPVTFSVIAEPSRRQILDLLREGERPVGDLVDQLGLSQPAVSKHLRVLRDAGLVEVRPDGQRRLYRLQPAPLAELDEWLAPYRAMWSRSLDRLAQHLEDHP